MIYIFLRTSTSEGDFVLFGLECVDGGDGLVVMVEIVVEVEKEKEN